MPDLAHEIAEELAAETDVLPADRLVPMIQRVLDRREAAGWKCLTCDSIWNMDEPETTYDDDGTLVHGDVEGLDEECTIYVRAKLISTEAR